LKLFSPRGKKAYVAQLPHSARLLDVGCGSNSPYLVKSVRPDIYYVGLDVADYHQAEESKANADKYLIVSPNEFDGAIAGLGTSPFDAVISCHNLEHCNRPDLVLSAMCGALRPGGSLYLSFPSEASTRMPSRQGTLNFYDDPTHRSVPAWRNVLDSLKGHGMEMVYTAQRYRPWAALLVGLVFEPFVAPLGKQAPKGGTWALYGFESIIWARKT
jgi:SAM-dependent methyltransferase